MKKIVFGIIAVMALAAFAACQKEDGAVAVNDGKCSLSISLGNTSDVSTKVAGVVADDDIIRDVQVFVFFKGLQGDKIDAAHHFTNLSAAGNFNAPQTLNCTRGHREVWVIVNSKTNYIDGNSTDMVTDLASLKEKTTLLSDNDCAAGQRSFVMAGNKIVDLNSENETVNIDVKRMASKIVIKSIKNEMALPVYRNSVSITGAYIMNVTGIQKLDNLNIAQYDTRSYMSAASIADSYWYGKNVRQDNALFSESFAARNVAYGGTVSDVSTFYVYPNDAPVSEEPTWSKRASLLVITANVSGQDCVYPVQIPTTESNKLYEVSLTIRHIGNDPDKPWEKIKFDDMTPYIKVLDWGTPVSVPETL